MKYHRPGTSITEIYFSQFCRLDVRDQSQSVSMRLVSSENISKYHHIGGQGFNIGMQKGHTSVHSTSCPHSVLPSTFPLSVTPVRTLRHFPPWISADCLGPFIRSPPVPRSNIAMLPTDPCGSPLTSRRVPASSTLPP